MKLLHLAGATALLTILSMPAVHAAQYRLTDLGTLGGSYSAASSINDHGVVTGQSSLAGDLEHHAFIYQNGAMSNLGLPGTISRGNAVNNANQIVGTHFAVGGSPFQPRGFLYDHGAITDLGTLGGGSTYPYDINDAGQVVGASDPGDGVGKAFIYDQGSMTGIPAGLPGSSDEAFAINDQGAITGRGSLESSLTPFVYQDGVLTILRDDQGGVLLGLGTDINNAGMVTGYARFNGSLTVSALLYRDGVVHNIGSLGGRSDGASLNERGDVVGSSMLADGQSYHAFIYNQHAGILDLNDLIAADSGWILSSASSINEAGQIVGSGLFNGVQRAYLLTPVPEPSLWALALPGAFMVWRRAKKMAG